MTSSKVWKQLLRDSNGDIYFTNDLGLETLDNEMGKDEWLIAFAPITVLTTGGFVAVNFFRNRQSTADLDYLLEPQWAYDEDVKKPVQRAVLRAARHLSFVEDWANEEMALFTPKSAGHICFRRQRDRTSCFGRAHIYAFSPPHGNGPWSGS